jgi:hypothetical protein
VPQPQQPPRRRATDRDRRRWSDPRLDDLKEDVEDKADRAELVALNRVLEQYMKTTDSRLDRMHGTLEKLRDENRAQHKRVAYGLDPEDGKTPLPPRPATLTWATVAQAVTIIGAFFGSAAIIVAALLSAH